MENGGIPDAAACSDSLTKWQDYFEISFNETLS